MVIIWWHMEIVNFKQIAAAPNLIFLFSKLIYEMSVTWSHGTMSDGSSKSTGICNLFKYLKQLGPLSKRALRYYLVITHLVICYYGY